MLIGRVEGEGGHGLGARQVCVPLGVTGAADEGEVLRLQDADDREGGLHRREGGDGDRLGELLDPQGVEEALGDDHARGEVVLVLRGEPAPLRDGLVMQEPVAQAHGLGGYAPSAVGEGEADVGGVGRRPGLDLVALDEAVHRRGDLRRGRSTGRGASARATCATRSARTACATGTACTAVAAGA